MNYFKLATVKNLSQPDAKAYVSNILSLYQMAGMPT